MQEATRKSETLVRGFRSKGVKRKKSFRRCNDKDLLLVKGKKENKTTKKKTKIKNPEKPG
ncbi:hypothetical protein GmHk_04G010015 [Glycine max]|uniref:Uncharacterized protein n=1 Tax=Glycine max TaxID=3847 RepID=K7KJ95_SOYBN|nr:hypothetical protein JHK85_009839 [Glycine max]KAH1110736.1 hypothetical protein GYH30_009508 [Glycine max]KAH1253313.1 hypothetical protein GmHk_04G010015 [Glycine max]